MLLLPHAAWSSALKRCQSKHRDHLLWLRVKRGTIDCFAELSCWGLHRMAFQSVSEQHLAAIAAQLLLAEGIQDVGTWLPIICCLALEAAQSASPSAMVANGNIDPRFYIKVSCPG